ncbi:DUF2793 domain-containing protein [Aestuariivirga sp.]|jgi:hypothetical protein|uniref:DUF2793 domain-containing protein n=1 Tax=Aestuariivirga sp. TaxID=2650926 RepID=UPI0037852D08
MSETPLLKLPLLSAQQAQKHITHNEALLLLEAAVQLSVIGRGLAAPPAAAEDGARYLVPAGATGAWAGKAGQLALMQGGSWVFLMPRKGWRMWVEDEGKLLLHDGVQWLDLLAFAEFSNLQRLGVNATADTTNRLAVSAAATLFTHAGSDHRLKLNKNAAGDTASLLYQTGFAGRAELGLAGNDDFAIKVSADGVQWTPALVIDRASGAVSLPSTPGPAAALFGQSLSSQGPGFATDTYLAGSGLVIPAGRLRAGTRYILAFDASKSAAGLAAPIVSLRFGSTQSVADALLAQLAFPAQTAAADDGRFLLEVTFRSVGPGTAAVVQAVASLVHSMASGGLASSPGPVRRATSAGFNSTLANAVLGVSVNAGAGAAWTVSLVQAQLENLQ